MIDLKKGENCRKAPKHVLSPYYYFFRRYDWLETIIFMMWPL